MEKVNKVAVIYNGQLLLSACIAALRKQTCHHRLPENYPDNSADYVHHTTKQNDSECPGKFKFYYN